MKIVYYPGKEVQRNIYVQYKPVSVICTLKSGIIKGFRNVTMSSQLRLANTLWNLYLEEKLKSRPAIPDPLGVVFTVIAEIQQVPKDLPLREIHKGQRPPQK